jgi:hypothetical protein
MHACTGVGALPTFFYPTLLPQPPTGPPTMASTDYLSPTILTGHPPAELGGHNEPAPRIVEQL